MGFNNNRPGGTTGFVTPTGQEVLQNKDIDGGTASNTSRITVPSDTKANLDALARKAGTIFYATDLKQFFVDDGTSLVAAGSGSGGINYFENGDFEIDATTGVSTPGTITLDEEAGSGALFGTRSSRLVTTDSSNTHVDYAITGVDNASEEGGLALGLTAFFKLLVGADADWSVGLYNTTDSVYVTEKTDITSGIFVYRSLAVLESGKTYVLRVEYQDASPASGRSIMVDGLKLTPDSSTAIQAFEQRTVWVDDNELSIVSASSGLGGSKATGVTHARARSFADANGEYWLEFQVNLTSASSIALSFLFDGVTVAAVDQSIDGSPVGAASGYANYSASVPEFVILADASASNWVASGIVRLASKPTWFDANVDNQKVNLITPDLLTANSRAAFYRSANVGYTANTTAPYNVTEYNDGGGFLFDGAGTVTCNFSGTVEVLASFHSTTTVANGTNVRIKRDATIVKVGSDGNHERSETFARFKVTKGQTVTIEFNETVTMQGLADRSRFEITRVADIGAHEPVGFGLATSSKAGLTYGGSRFHAYASSSDSIGGATALNLAGIEFDPDGVVSGNIFTAPVDGYYQLNAAVTYQGVGGGDLTTTVEVTKNGAGNIILRSGSISGNNGSFERAETVSGLVKLTSGDQIRLQARSSAATNSVTGAEKTFLSGFLVHAI